MNEYTFTFTAALKIKAKTEDDAWYKFNTMPSKDIRNKALFLFDTTELDEIDEIDEEDE